MTKKRLSQKQLAAITALMEQDSIRSAANACGVCEATMHAYLKDGNFLAALREANDKVMTGVISRLTGMGKDALNTLTAEMVDQEAKSSERTAAAKATLDFLFKAYDVAVTQRRLEDLEAKLEHLENGDTNEGETQAVSEPD